MTDRLKQQENEALEKCYNVKHGGVYCYSEDAMREMFQKGVEAANKWISIHEHPNHEKQVLLKQDIGRGKIKYGMGTFHLEHEGFYGDIYPTHWRPIE